MATESHFTFSKAVGFIVVCTLEDGMIQNIDFCLTYPEFEFIGFFVLLSFFIIFIKFIFGNKFYAKMNN